VILPRLAASSGELTSISPLPLARSSNLFFFIQRSDCNRRITAEPLLKAKTVTGTSHSSPMPALDALWKKG